ncbi:MAG: hypothetical protein SFV18_01710 [Bryobacteraceae bacterium]|nr:hypothetical protein [Bryobacteraceae bacterium]
MEGKLDALLGKYRAACPEPEGSIGFMPALWQRIDAQRRVLRQAKGWTSATVTFAAVLCLVLALMISLQSAPRRGFWYVEALDGDDDGVVETTYQNPGGRP